MAHRVFIFLLMLAAMVSACGCGGKGTQATTKEEASVAGGFAKTAVGYVGALEYVEKLNGTALTDRQGDYLAGVVTGIRLMNDGALEAKKPCEAALKQIDADSRADAKVYRNHMIIGVILAALSIVAMIALQSVTGIPTILKRLGHAGFGGAIAFIVLMMGLKESQRFLHIVTPIAAVIFCVAILVIVYTLVAQWREMRKQNLINREMVGTTRVALAAVPEEAKPVVYETIKQIQSPPTTEMVKEVRATEAAASTDVVAAAEGAVEATKDTLAAAKAVEP